MTIDLSPTLEHKLLELHKRTALLVALFDEQDVLRFANPAFCRAYDVAATEHPARGALMPRNALAEPDAMRRAQPFRSYEVELADGRWIMMTETVEEQGWLLCVGADMTPIREAERQLRQACDISLRDVHTDVLTGVGNRHFLFTGLESVVAERADRVCVAVFEIDRFRRINDERGHLGGDTVLGHFARHIQQTVRGGDAVGRIGTASFMVILRNVDQSEGRKVAARIVGGLRTQRPLRHAPDFGYTCSAGLTCLRANDTADSLYSRANQALRLAQSGGENRLMSL
ncbi:GGDEF domain-containing protein [Paludibacterium paludis]|uniref:diguanylate cyclase n=1 Tax=Paludibacterium paludis TaxID=1225769 RepID=A0A918U9Y2_9NEIS|nr:GGDEF domain-containing protein [Paludibacterium paludis]GGY15312.1 GGDEF domain-containing protein [Paludibacterium paludis]